MPIAEKTVIDVLTSVSRPFERVSASQPLLIQETQGTVLWIIATSIVLIITVKVILICCILMIICSWCFINSMREEYKPRTRTKTKILISTHLIQTSRSPYCKSRNESREHFHKVEDEKRQEYYIMMISSEIKNRMAIKKNRTEHNKDWTKMVNNKTDNGTNN